MVVCVLADSSGNSSSNSEPESGKIIVKHRVEPFKVFLVVSVIKV